MDTRTDVYAPGALLYELLAGAAPFDPTTLAKAADEEIRRIIREAEPPRPSTRLTGLGAAAERVAADRKIPLGDLKVALRSELDWIPLKAMRKDRDRRYDSAAQLSDDIANYLSRRALLAAPESRLYRLRKFASRNRLPLATCGAFMLVILIGTGVYVRGIRIERDRAQAKARIAATANAFVAQMLAKGDPYNKSSDPVTRAAVMEAMIRRLDESALKDDPPAEAFLRRMIGETLRDLGDNAKAEPNLRAALALRREQLPPNDPEIAQSTLDLAFLYWNQDRPDEAESAFRDALSMRRNSLPANDPAIAATMDWLARFLLSYRRYDEAEPLLRDAADMQRIGLPADHADLAATLNDLGLLLLRRGRIADAEPFIRQALDIRRRSPQAGDAALTASLRTLAELERAKGSLANAESLWREALGIQRKIFPPGHPAIAEVSTELGEVLLRESKLSDAEILLGEAIETCRKISPPANFDLGNDLFLLGKVLVAQGRPGEAEPLLRQSIEYMSRKSDHTAYWTARSAEELASLLDRAGRDAGAAAIRTQFHLSTPATNRVSVPPASRPN